MSTLLASDSEQMTGADGMGTVKGYNRMSLSVGPFKKKKEKYRYLSTKLGDNV